MIKILELQVPIVTHHPQGTRNSLSVRELLCVSGRWQIASLLQLQPHCLHNSLPFSFPAGLMNVIMQSCKCHPMECNTTTTRQGFSASCIFQHFLKISLKIGLEEIEKLWKDPKRCQKSTFETWNQKVMKNIWSVEYFLVSKRLDIQAKSQGWKRWTKGQNDP